MTLIAVFAAVLIGAASPTAGRAKPCGVYSVHAVIAGRATCLRDEEPCRTRLEAQYRRYGFHCRADKSLVASWRLLARPLHIPSIESGGTCPISNPQTRVDFAAVYGTGRGLGPGPAYPAHYDPRRGLDLDVILLRFPPPPGYFAEESEWNGWKHVWVVGSAYQGPVLIRGRQLDGGNDVRFGGAVVPSREHRLSARPRQLAGTFRFERTFSRVRTPGCYAYQIDGTTFSYVVVFEVRAA